MNKTILRRIKSQLFFFVIVNYLIFMMFKSIIMKNIFFVIFLVMLKPAWIGRFMELLRKNEKNTTIYIGVFFILFSSM
jgi:hypothetical protein